MTDNLPAAATTPPISHKIRRAIAAMVSGEAKTQRRAAQIAGITPEHLSREMNKPHVEAYMHQRVRRSLAMAAAKAGYTKIALLDSSSEIVRDRASSYVLGMAGIAPEQAPSMNVNIDIKAGWIIDLREPDEMRSA